MTIRVTPKRSAKKLKRGSRDGETSNQLASATEKCGLASADFGTGRTTRQIGKKVFNTPVWKVSKSEAAALAWPEVQKFEALIKKGQIREMLLRDRGRCAR